MTGRNGEGQTATTLGRVEEIETPKKSQAPIKARSHAQRRGQATGDSDDDRRSQRAQQKGLWR